MRPATAARQGRHQRQEGAARPQVAAENLRDASEALRAPKKRKKSRLGRIILLGLVGAAVALILSEDARKTVLDALFGAEEEFEYTSTTSINGS